MVSVGPRTVRYCKWCGFLGSGITEAVRLSELYGVRQSKETVLGVRVFQHYAKQKPCFVLRRVLWEQLVVAPIALYGVLSSRDLVFPNVPVAEVLYLSCKPVLQWRVRCRSRVERPHNFHWPM